ncbi:hypothetical protein COS54_02715 [Candidatus Shapirobacteria bacterium CG03_land_8_20_14_0_80_39_12]|uniref:UvrD-like helicase C-terminal domain-containing protein n=1 Tax=Candidatus Shapirobacteria bacterium CG03_land_8_20_14_0_80_39_12 TaxID=1974879 RepID=A0A2M7BBV5_9BACT|nr:MAG: hypothetical protein COS54_02715 [Candidatus Shapirobacteria bacterium CG03_land_8_20_14_0_80_39_12]
MQDPDLKLEEIHRQAKENPIIGLSIMARENGQIPIASYGKNIKKLSFNDPQSQELIEELLKNYNENTLVLCGYNRTRIKINNFIRNHFGFEGNEPRLGDRVICLRNNHVKSIFNGMLGTVLEIKEKNEEFYLAQIKMDGEEEIYQGLIYKAQFGASEPINFTKERYRLKTHDIFDFGYALTVHKAQGSQAKDEWQRWLYNSLISLRSINCFARPPTLELP